MKNMFNSIKGSRKKRHSVGIQNSGTFDEPDAEGGDSLKGRRASVEPPGRHGSGKFGTLLGKMKEGVTGRSGSASPYVSDPEDDGDAAPAPQLNYANYGGMADEANDPVTTTTASNAQHRPAPAPPQIQVQKAPEYVEDDPSLKVLKIVDATYDYDAQDATEMTFVKGDRIAVYSYKPDRWGKGRNVRTKQRGEFPCNRTNVSEVPDRPNSARRPLPPGPGEAPKPQEVQRVAVDAPVGSPAVQRLSFFDNLNQDIAYREAKEQERASGRQHSPGRVQVVQQRGPSPRGPSPRGPSPVNHSRGMPPQLSAQSASAPGAVQQVRREEVTDQVGSATVQRLSFFDNLNQDIAYRERKSQAEPASSGPTISVIKPSAEEYPEHERGTE